MSSWKSRGVRGPWRVVGVGVEVRKISLGVECEEDGRRVVEVETARKFVLNDLDDDGRSSGAGGTIPSSVYNQSIWTKVADN